MPLSRPVRAMVADDESHEGQLRTPIMTGLAPQRHLDRPNTANAHPIPSDAGPIVRVDEETFRPGVH